MWLHIIHVRSYHQRWKHIPTQACARLQTVLDWRCSLSKVLCAHVPPLSDARHPCRRGRNCVAARHMSSASQSREGALQISCLRSGCSSASALPTWRVCWQGEVLLGESHCVGRMLLLPAASMKPESSSASETGAESLLAVEHKSRGSWSACLSYNKGCRAAPLEQV